MSVPPESTPSAQPPITTPNLRRSSAKNYAAGPQGVAKSLLKLVQEPGLVRGQKTLMGLNQKGGFDCPSCAWPDPDGKRSSFEYCENGAKAVAWESTTKRVTPDFFEQHTISELLGQTDHWLEAQGRLTHPMYRAANADRYVPITWDEAFTLLATELQELPTPDDAIFYTSGRTSNEAAFLYQLLARSFGTNNLPDCSNMCHESSGAALSSTLGLGKGSVKLEDFEQAQAIFILGQNPGTNHPRMLSALQDAARAGAEIVVFNPLKEAGLLGFAHPQEFSGLLGRATSLATQYHQVRINGDHAALLGLNKALFEAEAQTAGSALDRDFLEAHCTPIEPLREHLTQLSWETIESGSGLTREALLQAAEVARRSERIIVCWAMGLTQHHNAVATIQEAVNLLLLRGSLGKPGAGVCPVRGHSNVQGDRTMGIWEKAPESFLQALDTEFSIQSPRHYGVDTVEAIRRMRAEPGKIFFAMGGNFLSATPDTERTAEGLRNCRMTVQVSTKLNRSHLVTGQRALILPCLGRTEIDRQAGGEQFVTMENSMGVVHASRGRLAPASDTLKSEVAIVAGLASVLFGESHPVAWREMAADYDRIREAISRVIPGCADYNQRVREPGGFYLPNNIRDLDFSKVGGRAKISVNALETISLEDDQLLLMTIRSHDQFNTTIYDLNDRYRGIHGERRVVFLNREDMAARGLVAEQPVDLTSYFKGEERLARLFLVVPYDIPRGCAAAYFPETNVLVPLESTARTSNTPTSKSIVIRVTPASATTTRPAPVR